MRIKQEPSGLRNTSKPLRFLQKMIRIDGSMESLLIVLTGADVRINEDQLHYLDAKQRHVIQEMSQAINSLSNSLEELEKKTIATIPYDMAALREYMERQQKKDEITSQLRTKQATKNTYIAVCIPVLCSYIYSFASRQHQRSARVREAFLQLYRQVYYSISKQVLRLIFKSALQSSLLCIRILPMNPLHYPFFVLEAQISTNFWERINDTELLLFLPIPKMYQISCFLVR
ncbi:hypothetical protein EV702DRAFT_676491 [Suillus placidus]|uniref:Uncharacterized protein n=1 Tax=Suillus placidus TaxID=48579 RepID=A0A9P6ZKD0_9AGAM|nr:hypothetical protein EV702DRAFT_676491 [Suillus placidus]